MRGKIGQIKNEREAEGLCVEVFLNRKCRSIRHQQLR